MDTSLLLKADLYRILATALDLPDGDKREDLAGLIDDLLTASVDDEIIEGSLRRIRGHLDSEGLEAIYHRLFTSSDALPFSEGGYLALDKGHVIGDVSAFYKAFGFKLTEHAGSPDAVKIELGFMAFLNLREYQAHSAGLEEQKEIVRDAKGKFLREHLAGWIPLFLERLTGGVTHPFYTEVAVLLQLMMERDMSELMPVDCEPVEK